MYFLEKYFSNYVQYDGVIGYVFSKVFLISLYFRQIM